jgi:hypothetical protein
LHRLVVTSRPENLRRWTLLLHRITPLSGGKSSHICTASTVPSAVIAPTAKQYSLARPGRVVSSENARSMTQWLYAPTAQKARLDARDASRCAASNRSNSTLSSAVSRIVMFLLMLICVPAPFQIGLICEKRSYSAGSTYNTGWDGDMLKRRSACVIASTWSSCAPLGNATHSSMKSFTQGANSGCGR